MRQTKAGRRLELSQRIAEGAVVTVLPSQAGAMATKREEDAYLSGWFDGAADLPKKPHLGHLGAAWADGHRDGLRYRVRKHLGLEKYSGPGWQQRLRLIEARAAGVR